MPDETITTRSVGRGFAEIQEDFVLDETTRTKTVFQAQIHSGGFRGQVIRYRKDANGNPEETVPVNFNQLYENEGIKIELGTEAAKKLDEAFAKLIQLLQEHGVHYGQHQFSINEAGALVITDSNKAAVVRGLLEQNLTEEVWNDLSQSNPDLVTRLSWAKIQANRATALAEFEQAISDTNKDETWWQDFFSRNTWIFGYGLNYQILRTVQEQPNYGRTNVTGSGGERGDFLQRTAANVSFTVLVEMKKPATALLHGTQYRNGAWRPSDELSGGAAQLQTNSLTWEVEGSRTDGNRDGVEGGHNAFTVRPKSILIIGNTSQLDTRDKKNSLELFRRNLKNPEVLTFDELLERARFIVQSGEEQL
ncbi:DUF4263 domain-containing protein [Candidatus Saccharibacteria bacterium]|nr:DUF4263 domain-containing protein [Candidatus Saccharibacteria bacterium]